MTDTATRIQLRADGRPVQLAIVATALLVAAAAFSAGVPALMWAMSLAGVPATLAWLAPVVIDAGLVVAALALSVRRSQQRPVRLEAATMIALTLVSVGVQAVHAVDAPIAHPLPALVAATVVAALLPVVTLLAVELAVRAVLAEPIKRGRTTAARPVAKPAAIPAATTSRPTTTPAAANRPVPIRPVATRPDATMTVEEAVAAARSGELSGRAAAKAAGVSRHAIATAIAA